MAKRRPVPAGPGVGSERDRGCAEVSGAEGGSGAGGSSALLPLCDRPGCCCFVTGRVPPASSSALRPLCPGCRPRRGWVSAPAPRGTFAGVGETARDPCSGCGRAPRPGRRPRGAQLGRTGKDPPLPSLPRGGSGCVSRWGDPAERRGHRVAGRPCLLPCLLPAPLPRLGGKH